MKAPEISRLLEIGLLAGQNPFIWGEPGIGKSDVAYQTAERMSYDGVIPLPCGQIDTIDQRGAIHLVDDADGRKRTDYAIPSMWPTEGKWIILLDDFNTAPPSIMAGFYQLLREHRIGNFYKLPPGCGIIGTGNRAADRAYVNQMSTANMSRFAPHMTFEVDFDAWFDYASKHMFRPEILAYMRLKNYEYLHRFDPKKGQEPYPCPRSWEQLSQQMNVWDQLNPVTTDAEKFQCASGTVGEAAGADFCGFLRIMDRIPNPDLCLFDPTGIDVPADPQVQIALAAAIARKAVKSNFDKVCIFSDRLLEEINAFLITLSINRDPGLTETPSFKTWAIAHPTV